MPDSVPFERRQHTRAPIVRTCKVRPSGALRFDGGTTEDASWGGVCVHVRTARRFVQGDTVELVIAWDEEAVAQAPASRASVRRVDSLGADGQRLALQLIREEMALEEIAAA